MNPAHHRHQLSAPHRKALHRAVLLLESPGFAARLADYAGQPVDRVLRMMPRVATTPLNAAVEAALMSCLKVAIGSIEPGSRRPPTARASSLLAGLSGGISGFFGIAALPVELPVTTALILRAIADLARYHGEDLRQHEARLACVEVFALSPRNGRTRTDIGYYASRALLSRLANEASALLIERGAARASAPVVSRFLAEIAARYGVVVSERIAASAIPVLGALGGASVNMIFMNHFQRVAHGHFTVRRLERRYGAAAVRRHYEDMLSRHRPAEHRG
jgi:hypothetical protein